MNVIVSLMFVTMYIIFITMHTKRMRDEIESYPEELQEPLMEAFKKKWWKILPFGHIWIFHQRDKILKNYGYRCYSLSFSSIFVEKI